MADIITTLHPEGQSKDNLYPNIKKENIPDGSIDNSKLSNGSIDENKIIGGSLEALVASWLNAHPEATTTVEDGSITTEKLNNDCLIKVPYLNGVDLNTIFDLGRYVAVGCINTPDNDSYLLEVQRYKSTLPDTPWVIQIAYNINNNKRYYRQCTSVFSEWKEIMTNESLFDLVNNFINPSKIENGKFINWTNGDIANSNEYRLYNDYIEIDNPDIYLALFNNNNGIFYDDNYAILGAYYDTNKNYLDEIYIMNSTTRGATFVNGFYKLKLPVGTKYVRLSVKDNVEHYNWFVGYSDYYNYVKYSQLKDDYLNLGGKLQGKTIVNFGDSIFGNTRDNTSVSSYIAQKTGAIVYNCGFGGCRMSKHAPNWDLCSMYNLADDIAKNNFTDLVNTINNGWSGMPGYFTNTAYVLANKIDFSKVDAITISYGTNDYREGDNLIGNNNVNIFDNEFDESGFINPSTGEDAESSNFKRTSKYYPIKSVSSLYSRLSELTPTFVLLFYDLNGNYLDYSSHYSSDLTCTLKVPNGAVCYRVYADASFSGIACISYEASETSVSYFNNEYVIDCLKYSVRTIQKAYPDIKILITTPIYRSFLNSNNEVLTNSDVMDFGGGTLEDYSKAYIDACKELKVPCLDLYHISELNKETRDYYYPADDGTHPNEKGRKNLGYLIGNMIERIL